MPPIRLAAPTANRLLMSLPCQDRERLLADCEQIQLIFDEPLYAAGERIPHVYFPIGSIISLVTPLESGSGLDIGLIGDEGMLGITLIMGIDVSPFQALVQGEGLALRMPTPLFLKTLPARRHHCYEPHWPGIGLLRVLSE